MFLVFFFLSLFSLIHAVSMFDFHLWGLRWRRFCTSHITLLYTLVNQVGSGKELLEKASDVELCCVTAHFHGTQGADCTEFRSHSIFDAQRRLHLAPERSNGRILRLLQPAIPLTAKTREDWFHFREVVA